MSDVKESVQKQFTQVAERYLNSSVHASGPDLGMMVEGAGLDGSEIVLDAGCGTGHTAFAFAPHVKQVIGCDLTLPMLQQFQKVIAERNIKNVGAMRGDVEQLPFGARSFDRVVSRYSAHHWPRPQTALYEFHRVLKPGGRLILSDVVSVEELTQDSFLQTIEMVRDPSHVRDHTITQWFMMLIDAGFEVDQVKRFEIRLGFQAWVERMATPPTHIEVVKSLFRGAADDVRASFQLPKEIGDADFEFVILGAVMRARRAG